MAWNLHPHFCAEIFLIGFFFLDQLVALSPISVFCECPRGSTFLVMIAAAGKNCRRSKGAANFAVLAHSCFQSQGKQAYSREIRSIRA